MPLVLKIESELDERSATAAADRAQRIYTNAAQDMSKQLSEGLTKGAREGGQAIEKMATDARTAYKRVGDATDELREQERQLKEMRDQGARGVEVQAERVRQARKREKEAIREAAAAYDEYERAARGAGQAGEQAGDSIMSGLRNAVSSATGAGQDTADSFVSGFAGASALTRLAAASGPVGAVLVGIAGLGVMAGKVLADNIAAGLQSQATKDLFQARLGVDDATMGRYGQAAGSAFADMWGASVADNLRAVQFAVQGGVIAPGASDAEIEATIANMQALATIMEVDVQEAARATGQLIRGGFASSGEEAADIIAAGFQNGLDIAGDWLDTITEYTTQFRKLGLDGADALGLIQQGLQGGARDSDKVADSLKEFSIRAVDGSKLSAEGFQALGFNADEMAQRFLAGGESARSAFGATLQAIRSLEDPIQQALVWQALFGTQWEDMGDAINSMDLSTARTEFGSTEGAISSATGKLSEHINGWDALGRSIDLTFTELKKWLADSAIGKFLSQDLPNFLNMPFADYPMPGPVSYTNPDAAPTQPINPLDILAGGGTAPGAGSTPTPSGPGGLLLPSLTGPIPPGGPGVPAPVPGDRTPMLTDTQQQAADEANGGSESLPPAPVLPIQYTPTTGLPTAVANAQTRLDEAAHDAAEKQARVNQLEQSNIATADDIQKAKNDLLQSQQRQQQAERALQDAQISATEKYTNQLSSATTSMSELGAGLDSDFGISRGLAGIADNLVRFVGSLALAGPVAKLQQISDAAGDEGSGLMGILASNGAFGPQFMPGAGRGSSYVGTPYGSAGIPRGGAPTEDQVKQIAAAFGLQVTSEDRPGDPGYHGQGMALDVSNGSGNTPQMREFAEYMSTNFGSSLKELIYSDGSFSGLIGDGKNVTGTGYYDSGTLAEHQNHVHVAADWGGSALQSSGGPVPVNVVNGGSIAAPLTSAIGQWSADWNAIAQAESGGNWSINTGNGYSGGLQFSPSSWAAAGGTQYAPSAYQASPYQQALTAERLLAMQGPGAWPNTFVPGSTGPSPDAVGPAGPLPSFIPGGAAGGPLGTGFPQGLPGLGGQAYPAQGGGGGIGMGGMAMDAAMLGTSTLDMMAPGAGAAAKVGIQLANRTIKYAGQVAGIGVSGLMETFLPAGDNPKASIGNSWFGKIAGGIASAAPAIPNAAGGKPKGQDAQKQQGGNTINNTVNLTNNRATEDMAGNQAVREMGAMYAPSGTQ